MTRLNVRKWNVFGATDFVSLVKPSIFICRLYGLIPYTIVNSKIEYSTVVRLYCTLVTVSFASLSLFVLYVINASPYIAAINIWLLQGNCFYTLVNFILVSNYVFGKPILKIMQCITETTAKLPSEKFAKLAKWIRIKDWLLYFFLFIHVPKLFYGHTFMVIWKIIGHYGTVSIYSLDFQYTNYVMVLTACFKHINEELVKLKDSVIMEQDHLLRKVYHRQLNPVLFLKLQHLKQWHYELNKIIRKMNSTFSLQIVATVITTFTELTFGLYFYILALGHKAARTLDNEVWYYYYNTVVVYFSSKLVLITLVCQNANDENFKTRSIINEILINTDDKLFKEELHLFSLQLLHTNYVFTAKGVKIDATLLTAMAKGIFTYLLILIQFLMTSK